MTRDLQINTYFGIPAFAGMTPLTSIDDSLRLKDKNETSSEVLRMEPDNLIQKMQSQSQKWGVQEIDEIDLLRLQKNIY